MAIVASVTYQRVAEWLRFTVCDAVRWELRGTLYNDHVLYGVQSIVRGVGIWGDARRASTIILQNNSQNP